MGSSSPPTLARGTVALQADSDRPRWYAPAMHDPLAPRIFDWAAILLGLAVLCGTAAIIIFTDGIQ